MRAADVTLAQLGMTDEGPLALVSAAAAAGFGGIGLPLRSGALKPLLTEIVGEPGLIRGLRDACTGAGIRIFDVEALVLGHLPAPEDLAQLFDTAATLGASRVSCLGYEAQHGPGTIATHPMTEEFARLCATAAGFDLTVAVEFMAFRAIGSLAAARTLIEAVGAPNAGIVLDALHVQRTGATVAEIADLPVGMVSHLQLCDARLTAPAPAALAQEARADRLLPGEGVIPLTAILAALPQGTPVSLEIPSAQLMTLSVAERARVGAASIGWL